MLFVSTSIFGADKYSVATGNWNSTSTWSLTSGGSSGAPVPVAGDVVFIEGGYTVTVNAGTGSLTSLSIASGSTLSATGSNTVSATTITVNGLYLNGSTGTITATTMSVNSGGTYQHNVDGARIPTSTWNTGSTCNVSGVVSNFPSGTTQSYYNFTWSSVNTSSMTSFAPTAIAGDFSITAGGTGTRYLGITTVSFTVGGNLNISGSGNLQVATGTTRSITVNGNFVMTGGNLVLSSGSKTGTLNVKGNYTHSGGTITETSSSSGIGYIIFNGTTVQTYVSGSATVSNTIKYTVNSGATLQMADASTVVSGNSFTLNSGGTLGIKSTAGILLAGTNAGNIQTTTRSYSTSGNYIYNGTAAQVTGDGLTTANNLTINNSAGITASGHLTVNGILNLQSANPSATKGALEMTISYANYPGTTNTDYLSSYLLNMGSTASTTGTGDVTGTVKRSTIVANTPYSFGNQFTNISLTAGTMPSAISVSITIGNTAPGKENAVKRTYEIVSTGGSGCNMTANFHYLSSELQSSISPFFTNTEAKMVTWDYDIDGGTATPDEHGRADYDFTNKYIGFANIPISYFINTIGHTWRTIFMVADYDVDYYTWVGTTSVWGLATNWSPNGVPSDLSHVIIPDAATTANDPVLPAGITVNTLTIENGGVLVMGSNTLTIKNSLSGGWEDRNTNGNDPGTSTVVFSNPGTTISGNARFYNVQISGGADITNQLNSTIKIGGTVTKTGNWYADIYTNTVEYNGAGAQDVVLTNGTASYHNLTFSGAGSKTIPASVVKLNGNFVNNGTFSPTGSTITMSGNSAQTISGTNIEFDNLTISSSVSTTLGANVGVRGNLRIPPNSVMDLTAYTCNRSSLGGEMRIEGTMRLGGNTGGQTGSNFPSNFATMTLAGGIVEYYGNSQTVFAGATYNSLLINGTGTVSMPGTDMVMDYLTLNQSNGLILQSNLTINKSIHLTNGLLTIGDKNITLGFEATITGTPSSTNMIVATGTGELRKVFTGAGSFEFPVGSNTGTAEYSPVTLNFTSGTFASSYAGIKLDNHKHPNNTSTNSYLNRYWTVTQSNITGFSCDVTLQYLPSDIVGSESAIYCGKYDGSTWTLLTLANSEAQQLNGTVTSFSAFTGGEQGVMPVSLSSLSSSVSGRNIKLNWTTLSEINNSGFDIERADAKNEKPVYIKAGFVNGKGTVNTATNYNFEDRNLQTGKYKYRLKQIDNNGNFEYYNLSGEVEVGVPAKYDLGQNYPNPFNPVTKINFELPYDSKVEMTVFDVLGREMKKLMNESRSAGYHTIVFDASNFSSGVYFYRINAKSTDKEYLNIKKITAVQNILKSKININNMANIK
jgi:hypothetical protein